MKTMTDSEILEKYQQPFPVSFKVIGVGTGASGIIEKVKSFGYDCVDCILAETPSDSTPMDDDAMVIIVARDNTEIANAIANSYRDAGVLTIGLVHDADVLCYDSVATDAGNEDYPEIIRSLFLPVVSPGYMCYDFNDLCAVLRDSRFFRALTTVDKSVEDAGFKMQKELENVDVRGIGSLSAHLYFNHERQPAVTVNDMTHLSSMITILPESINVIWYVNHEDTLPEDLIRFTIIMSGHDL